jgi:hypothetical protein
MAGEMERQPKTELGENAGAAQRLNRIWREGRQVVLLKGHFSNWPQSSALGSAFSSVCHHSLSLVGYRAARVGIDKPIRLRSIIVIVYLALCFTWTETVKIMIHSGSCRRVLDNFPEPIFQSILLFS